MQFYRNARLLPKYQRDVSLTSINQDHNQSGVDKRAAYARLSPPFDAPVSGDGQLGVFEGLTSDISVNGKQPQSNGERRSIAALPPYIHHNLLLNVSSYLPALRFAGMRCDCVTETVSFAVRSVVTETPHVVVATNLLNYGHLHAGRSRTDRGVSNRPDCSQRSCRWSRVHVSHQSFCRASFPCPYFAGYSQPWAVGAGTADGRPWVVSGDTFGLMSWTTSNNAYDLFYKVHATGSSRIAFTQPDSTYTHSITQNAEQTWFQTDQPLHVNLTQCTGLLQDDDARGLLGAIATAGLLKQERWHSTITTATLANLRAASKNGFGPSSWV